MTQLVDGSATWASHLDILRGRRLVLVVTGGVAAYKAADLARMYTKAGAQVRTILTASANKFITPLTFEALTGQLSAWDMWAKPQTDIEHIAWADWAEAAIAAPATANFLAKAAHGLADDLASSFWLAYSGPKLIAPAMNHQMYENPATQDNLALLRQRGHQQAGPAHGLMACGTTGQGRLAELDHITLSTARLLVPQDFAGQSVLITAGATTEPWDAIRYLTNRSTGLMGLELALAAWLRGAAKVKLLRGPNAVKPPANLPGLESREITDTQSLLDALKAELPDYGNLIMAAAPADFKPAERVEGKIKKESGAPVLNLSANPDILKTLAPLKGGRFFVGFAAEDQDLLPRAKKKLEAKSLDMIVANRAGGAGDAFGAGDNHLWLIAPNAAPKEIGLRPKFAGAWAILDEMAAAGKGKGL